MNNIQDYESEYIIAVLQGNCKQPFFKDGELLYKNITLEDFIKKKEDIKKLKDYLNLNCK